ncbi:MAG: hypothetical protein ACFFD6_11225 [Candidatus Thorarchaeota archaeon]
MSRRDRDVPKEIGLFGQRQFKETGAAAVEVLRVKASTMRKHFSKLRGITFLVAVISLDRVRVYFFNSNGVMLVAENIESTIYQKVRKTSKLIAKFEKPRELTQEEIRIEATEELRQELSKILKRLARNLGRKEPEFPSIFVTRDKIESQQQFGLVIEDDGALVFEQKLIESKLREGIITRAAFLQFLDSSKRASEISAIIGNAVAFSSISQKGKPEWLEKWIEYSSDSPIRPIVNHFRRHSECYSWRGFELILEVVERVPDIEMESWMSVLAEIHSSVEIPLGTEDHLAIQGFCSSLKKPRKLVSRRHILESIHLAPRAICDPTPLGTSLSISEDSRISNPWLQIEYLKGAKTGILSIVEANDNELMQIFYSLGLEDIFPKPGGILGHGKDVIWRILDSLGISFKRPTTFQSQIQFAEYHLTSAEKAVLERLSGGSLSVLSDTLVGSPQRLDSLIDSGKVILLPDFNHIGLRPNFLLRGDIETVTKAASLGVESTILQSAVASYGLVSAPSSWGTRLLSSAAESGIEIWPIIEARSERRFIRSEDVFPSDSERLTWSEK